MTAELYWNTNGDLEPIYLNERRTPCGCCGALLVNPKEYQFKNVGLTITVDTDRICEDLPDYWEEKVYLDENSYLYVKHRKKLEFTDED